MQEAVTAEVNRSPIGAVVSKLDKTETLPGSRSIDKNLEVAFTIWFSHG